MFAAIFLFFLVAIFMRYVVGRPPAWPDELNMVLLLWTTFLAEALVLTDREQVTFDAVWFQLPGAVPADPNKVRAGQCGCGIADTDSDRDGTADCDDGCPQDFNKFVPGICSCNVSDIDTDRDGLADCVETCDLESFDHSPIECGCALAKDFTDAGARRSELPSRSTGLTAEPFTRSYASRAASSSGDVGSSG